MTSKENISELFNLLGQEVSVDNFSDRKKLQKLTYLAEAFDIDLGFDFTWYAYGPYSPQLTKIMFDKEQGEKLNLSETKNIEQKLDSLKNFLGNSIQSSDELELIASMHYLVSLVDDPAKSKDDIFGILADKKPQFSKEEVEKAFQKVNTAFGK